MVRESLSIGCEIAGMKGKNKHQHPVTNRKYQNYNKASH